MHIAINLGVQKLASFQVDNLLPQEIDHEINMAVRRFINQRYSPASNTKGKGFEQSQKRIDDLRTLLEDYHVAPEINTTTTTAESTGSFFGVVYSSPSKGPIYMERFKLPVDYMYLINTKCTLLRSCNRIPFDLHKIERAFLRIRRSATKVGKVIRKIEVPNADGVLETIFETAGVRSSSEDLLNPLLYSDGFIPSLSNQDGLADMFSESVVADSPHADSNEVYLQYPIAAIGDGSSAGEVLGSLTNNYGSSVHTVSGSSEGTEDGAYAKITYDFPGVDLSASTTSQETLIFEAPSISYEENRTIAYADLPNTSVRRTLCKAVQHDDIFALLDDPFNTAKSSNVMYTMQENFVDLYSDNKTVPLGVTLKYIRRPADVNLALGAGCELAEHTHHEIVEMTVKSILESFESPRYQTQSGEVLESE